MSNSSQILSALRRFVHDVMFAEPPTTLVGIRNKSRRLAESLAPRLSDSAVLATALERFVIGLRGGDSSSGVVDQLSRDMADASIDQLTSESLLTAALEIVGAEKVAMHRVNRLSQQKKASDRTGTAVLIDGSALFLATRHNPAGRLNYGAFMAVLIGELGIPPPDPNERDKVIWCLWTTHETSNASQGKFIEFAKSGLNLEVRTEVTSAASMVQVEDLLGPGTADFARASRLLRFDAAISFAIGRLAETHRIVAVSDSWALRGPLSTVGDTWGERNGVPTLAFFGSALDPRWRTSPRSLSMKLLDLDEFHETLFDRKEVKAPMVPRLGNLTY